MVSKRVSYIMTYHNIHEHYSCITLNISKTIKRMASTRFAIRCYGECAPRTFPQILIRASNNSGIASSGLERWLHNPRKRHWLFIAKPKKRGQNLHCTPQQWDRQKNIPGGSPILFSEIQFVHHSYGKCKAEVAAARLDKQSAVQVLQFCLRNAFDTFLILWNHMKVHLTLLLL